MSSGIGVVLCVVGGYGDLSLGSLLVFMVEG